MTLDDHERKNRGFYGFFLVISGCDRSLYHSQCGAMQLLLCNPDTEKFLAFLLYHGSEVPSVCFAIDAMLTWLASIGIYELSLYEVCVNAAGPKVVIKLSALYINLV